MRSTIAALFTFACLSGCTSTPARPSTAKASATPIETIQESPPPPVPPIASAIPTERRIPIFGGACPLFFPPHDVGTVVRIPASMMSKPMDPVLHALCACTKPGEYSAIVAEIDFGKGSVKMRAPESSKIHECLETLHVTFDPIPENDLPSSDCINCGPRYYGVFVDSPPPPKNTGLRLMYSFLLDRSSEVLDCPSDTHAERGECKSNAAPPPVPAKRTCGCDPGDLKCAIACAGTR